MRLRHNFAPFLPCSFSHFALFPTGSHPLISLIRLETCPAGRPANNAMGMKLPWKRGRMRRRNFPGRLPEEAGDMVLCACGSCSPSQGVRGGHRSPGGQRGGPQGQVTAVAHLFPDTSMLCNTEPVSTTMWIPHRSRCQILRENLKCAIW